MIPKRIIYTWFGRKPLPVEFIRYKNTWQENNPDFDIIEINEQNFDVSSSKFTSEAYEAGQMEFVSDVARIWAVNKYGGIYLDTDVEVLKPLDPLLNYHQFWGKEDAGLVASGLIFGSEKNDAILRQIWDCYLALEFNGKELASISTVKIVSPILRKYGLSDTRKFDYLQNNAVVFPPAYFAPLHYWGGGKIKSTSYTVHHYQDNPGWTSKRDSIVRRLIHEMMYYIPAMGRLIRWIKRKIK